MTRLICLMAAFMAGCGSTRNRQTQTGRSDTVQELEVRFEIQRDDQTGFIVRYSFSRPISGFRFLADHNVYRAKTWTALDPRIKWVSSDDRVEVALFDVPRDHAEFRVKAFMGPLAAAFDPYLKFSKDGIAVQMGQFQVDPLLTTSYKELKKGVYSLQKARFHATVSGDFAGRKSVIVEGRMRTLPADVSDAFTDGHDAYVYFGSGKMEEIHGSTALVDRSMPKWLQRRIRDDIGEAIGFYSQVLGPRPQLKINFLVTWEPDADLSVIPGADVGGSVMDGTGVRTIDLVVLRKRIQREDRGLLRKLQVVIFHELAHFWNRTETDDFRLVGWMVEGGADAITYRALRRLGRIGPEEYEETLSKKIKHCRENYKDPTVLSNLKPNDDYFLAYTCGLFASVYTERRLVDKDYFTFLKELFALRDRQGGKYTTDDYFTLLKERGGPAQEIESLRRWIEAPDKDRAGFVQFNPRSTDPNSR